MNGAKKIACATLQTVQKINAPVSNLARPSGPSKTLPDQISTAKKNATGISQKAATKKSAGVHLT